MVFRVQKTQDYTVMSNHHLRDKNLSLKAKGLLSQMLSLPEDWDYTLAGLAHINKEKVDAIRTAILELEREGYITRKRLRNPNGTLGDIEYTIHEKPIIREVSDNKSTLEEPTLENPILVNPTLEKPVLENPTQLNTNKQNTDLQNTDITSSSSKNIVPIKAREEKEKTTYRELVAKNICLNDLLTSAANDSDKRRIQMLYEIICKTVNSKAKTVRINSEFMPLEVVKSQFLKLGYDEIVYVCDVLDNPPENPIGNLEGYIKTLLYNSPHLAPEYWTQKVAYGEHGGGRKIREQKKTNQFNSFKQRDDYDFEELERKLLRN